MNVMLWIVQVFLALLFVASGWGKLTQPIDKLAEKYAWMKDVSTGLVRFIGVVEVLGAIGLIAPAAIGIMPILTAAAATGLVVFSFLAMTLHIRRKEPSAVVTTLVLLVVTALVAWGRFGPYAW